MESNARGALPSQKLRELIEGQFIIGATEKNISPASLDLTVSNEIYTIKGLLLPRPGEAVRDMLTLMDAKPLSLESALRPDNIYLVKLNESLSLPAQVYGYCNPKSSSGRLDIHVRVLADGVPRYDSVTPKGFKGELWAAIHPKSFSVKVHKGTAITQLRLFTGDTRFSELDLEIALKTHKLLWHEEKEKVLEYTDLLTHDQDGAVLLTAMIGDGVCGYECIANPDQVVDLENIKGYEPAEFFKPIYAEDNTLYLKRDKFYILSGAERVRIPPTFASEMIPMDERSGDFRSHYAGFLDPGWGWGASGDGHGRPFTLEVRTFEDLVVRKGQPIAKIRFECMFEEPDIHYDTKVSNYLTQEGPKLGKQFK